AGIDSTATSEFEPQWVKTKVAYTADRVLVVSGSAAVSSIERSPTVWTVGVDAKAQSQLEAVLAYFPGWTVSLDGKEIPFDVAESGRIRFSGSPGVHQIVLTFRRTPVRRIAEGLSWCFVGILGVLVMRRTPL